MDIYKVLKEKYGNIEEYCTGSGDWEDEGVEAFKGGNFSEAAEKFERVIVAIPDHYNAYEMCSYALYKNGEKAKAITYLKRGIETAKAFEGEGKLPQEMIDDMEESLKRMEEDKELDTEYIDELME